VVSGILIIYSQSIGMKCAFRVCTFHVFSIGSISSHTFPGGVVLMQLTGLINPSLSSQFMPQTSVSSPVPILRISPCLSTSLPSTIARHILDGEELISAFKKSDSGKQTAFRIRALREVGSSKIR
jgi:hypothetical protein